MKVVGVRKDNAEERLRLMRMICCGDPLKGAAERQRRAERDV